MQTTESTEPMESGATTPPAAPRRPRPLWLNRDYMLLWSGQTVSSVGTGVSRLAFPLLVLDLTNSAAQAGIVGALEALPYLLLSLPVGALIDRWDRKRVMILCDIGRALALGSVPLALWQGWLTITQLYVVAAIEGTLFVFFNLAEVACLPHVVSKSQLPAAVAQNQATDGVAQVLSPQFGGALYGILQSLPFLADAVSYAASVLSLFLIRARFQGERSATHRHLLVEIREGLVWLWRQPLIRYIAFLTGGTNFAGAGTALMLIVLAKQQGATPFTLGTLFAVAGVGGIVGSIVAAPIQRRLSFGAVIIGSSWVWALLFPLYAIAPSPLWLGVISAGMFLTSPIYNVVQFSYRISIIPDELQGRVNSVFRLLAFGFQPLGLALTGFLIQTVQVVPTVLLFSVTSLVLAILTTFNRGVREARPVHGV
ncbi:MAG TPA: MFS transporter [Ktedonobacterales bacterium]|nr:MFS transporter [Ktedonobacterales bacterium]